MSAVADQLALDESLLLHAEEGGAEILRVWDSQAPAIVLGAAGKTSEEICLPACGDSLQVLRRSSGGGTVLLGPGCLLFTLVLAQDRDSALAHVVPSYRWILERIARALSPFAPCIAPAGTSDLAWQGRKVSGNSQQRKRRFLLHHGTLLYNFDLALVPRYLKMPLRQPDYRQGRGHLDFLANLPATRAQLEAALRQEWSELTLIDEGNLPAEVRARAEALAHEKYSRTEWTFRR